MEVWVFPMFLRIYAAQPQMQDTSKLAEIIEGGATFERCKWIGLEPRHTVAG